MIRWVANLIFVFVAVALAIFFLRIQTIDGSVSIRVRDARERDALWRSIAGGSSAPVESQPSVPAEPRHDKGKPETPEPAVAPKKSNEPAPAGKPGKKPAEKELDREGLDNLIEKSL